MNAELNLFRDILNEQKGLKKAVVLDIENKERRLTELGEVLLDLEQSKLITQFLAKQNQDKLAVILNKTVTKGIQSVFGGTYQFTMVIETKGETLQAIPTLSKGGFVYSPKSSEGGGVLQMVSLALRVCLLVLLKDPTPIVILDEIFKDVGKKDLGNACKMVKILSEEMNIQFILTTHAKEIVDVSDSITYVEQINKVSVARPVTSEEAKELFQKMEDNKEEKLEAAYVQTMGF